MPNQRFERIKPENVTFHHDGLKDNSFQARVSGLGTHACHNTADAMQEWAGAGANDYGAKASRDLIVTRGAGFRKEKNKKKRGVSLMLEVSAGTS